VDPGPGLDAFVFAAVIAARLVVPLAIPRYPLPGILAALVIDGIDQPLFLQFGGIDLDTYQTLDKALDIYYLTLAYVATLRNWSNPFALRVGRYLWYYRLVGVALFELTGLRWLLLVFPNVFEYFFILYEVVRVRWNPARMSRRFVLTSAAVIFVTIKLPQEFWVHIAQGDTTDFIKVSILGASLDDPWIEVLAEHLVPVAAVSLGALAALSLAWLILQWRIPVEHPVEFHADAYVPEPLHRDVVGLPRVTNPFERRVLVEQVALVSLVVIIFGGILPGWQASPFQVVVAVGVFLLVNATISVFLGRRGMLWRGALAEFALIGAMNAAIVVAYGQFAPRFAGSLDVPNALFFVALFTLIVTLHDRYRSLRRLREEQEAQEAPGEAA
jgi:hypothetical protein